MVAGKAPTVSVPPAGETVYGEPLRTSNPLLRLPCLAIALRVRVCVALKAQGLHLLSDIGPPMHA